MEYEPLLQMVTRTVCGTNIRHDKQLVTGTIRLPAGTLRQGARARAADCRLQIVAGHATASREQTATGYDACSLLEVQHYNIADCSTGLVLSSGDTVNVITAIQHVSISDHKHKAMSYFCTHAFRY